MKILHYVIITILLIVIEMAYFKIADRMNIVDKPNERSSHKSPIIRGGGIIFLIGVWVWSCFCGFLYPWFLTGMTLIAGVSFIDDIHSLPDSSRLMTHVVAMGMMFQEWNVLEWTNWWLLIIAFILCVGIINAYNFMDGINGITGGYSLAVLLPLLYLNCKDKLLAAGFIEVALLSVIVFCIFNFRKRARCFAGDVGSVGIAFLVVFILGKLIVETGDFTYIVFLAVYGVDSVLTIVHRIMLHENLGQAHRKHCYQLMANELHIPHVVVSTVYMLLQLIISAGLILIPEQSSLRWVYLAAVIVVLSSVYILFMKKYYHLHEEYLESLKSHNN